MLPQVENNLLNLSERITPPSKGFYVYFLMLEGEVVYVGKTVNLYQRLGHHMTSEKQFDSYHYITYDCAHDQSAAEIAYIVTFDPIHNKSTMDGSPIGFKSIEMWRHESTSRMPMRKLMRAFNSGSYEGEAFTFREKTYCNERAFKAIEEMARSFR